MTLETGKGVSVGTSELVPKEVGGFRILRRLASGASSDVLLARAEGPHGFQRVVALKIILAGPGHDAEFERNFAKEASAYARLSHPAVVKLYDFFAVEGQLVLVLEYVDGLPLHKLRAMLASGGHLIDDRAALFLGFRVFSALAAAHAARDPALGELAPIVHYEVNPSNVLVPWDGNVKVADFGIARAARIETDARTGFIKGTYGYSAPEQASRKEATLRADVYSAGLILWELLARRKAIQRGTLNDAQVAEAMAHPGYPSLDRVRPDLDASVRDAVRRALEPDPDRRDITAEAMVDVLRRSVHPDDGRKALAEAMGRVRPAGADPLAATAPVVSEGDQAPRVHLEGRFDPEETAPHTAVSEEPASDLGKIAFYGRIKFPAQSDAPPPVVGDPGPFIPPPAGVPQALRAGAEASPRPDLARTAETVAAPPRNLLGRSVPRPALDKRPQPDAEPPASDRVPMTDPVPSPPEKTVPGSSAFAADPPPADTSTAPTQPPPAMFAISDLTEPSGEIPKAPFFPPDPPPEPPVASAPARSSPSTERSPAGPVPPPVAHSRTAATVPPMVNAPPYVASSLAPPPPRRTPWALLAIALVVALGAAVILLAPAFPLPAAPPRPPAPRPAPSPAERADPPPSAASAPPAAASAAPPAAVSASAAAAAPSASAAPPPSASAAASASASPVLSAAVPLPPPPPPSAPSPPSLAPPAPPSPVASAAPSAHPPSPDVPLAPDMGQIDLPAAAAGHRVFVDGKVAGEGSASLRVKCGARNVRIGSAGVEKKVEVPCGGSVTLAP